MVLKQALLVLIKADHGELLLQILLLSHPHVHVVLPFSFVRSIDHRFELRGLLLFALISLVICKSGRARAIVGVLFLDVAHVLLHLILVSTRLD